jgi:hypothetical protein
MMIPETHRDTPETTFMHPTTTTPSTTGVHFVVLPLLTPPSI